MPFQETFYHRCRRLLDEGKALVTVTLVKAEGSTPQDCGGKMIVTRDGLNFGTVGGGRVEAAAIDHAQKMMELGVVNELVQWNLKSDIGMTCGGRVHFFFESVGGSTWPIVVFGAGHVAQALTRLVMTMPCQITCIDTRKDWLEKLPDGVDRLCPRVLTDAVEGLEDHSQVICMTQGHASDLPVLLEIWRQGRVFPFVGVIGSKTKRAALVRELRESGMTDPELSFHCPVGLPIGTNHPGEIAVSIAAQLLQVRDGRVE